MAGSLRHLPLIVLICLSACVVDAPSETPRQLSARLVPLLQDRSPDVRRTAAQALGKLGQPEAVPALVHTLQDDDALVRQHSAWALGAIGEPALDAAALPLVSVLMDPVPAVASAAALAIGQIGGTQVVVELLAETLTRAETAGRRAAVTALGWLEAPSSFPALVAALRDPDRVVRQGAVAALGELADPRAVPDLIERLHTDADPGVRNEAAYRLGKLGDRRAEPALRKAATDPNTAGWAAWALQELTSSRSVSAS